MPTRKDEAEIESLAFTARDTEVHLRREKCKRGDTQRVGGARRDGEKAPSS